MAIPSATGVEIASASTEEYSVPQMKGRAPNWPATGSQTSVTQNCPPNCRIDSHDSRVSTMPMATTMATSSRPNAPVTARKSKSSVRAFSGRRTELLYLQLFEGLQFEIDDGLWKPGVAKLRSRLLSLGQRPPHEVLHHPGPH